MNDETPQPPVLRAETAPAAPRRGTLGRFAAMGERAERLRWRVVARSRRPIRIAAPIATSILILLSPLILFLMGIAVFLPGRLRLNPALLMLTVGGIIGAVSGDGRSEDRRLS
ncbi:hypothetical protein [Phenylobacterium sp.]|uniref:hypothetical protein n=1 Tax=Phenylobacterium sp. TaxID=1871053 RepID=UPI0035B32C5F